MISELVEAPLAAVCDSKKKLAQSAYEFMTDIGYDAEGKTRTLEFNLWRPIEGSTTPQNIKIQAPFIGFVPFPNILIDDVHVDFQMEVTATDNSTEKSSSEGSMDPNAKFKFDCFRRGSVNVLGMVVSTLENTSSANLTAEGKIHISAHQQEQTEGFSLLMDIMASYVEPIKSNSK